MAVIFFLIALLSVIKAWETGRMAQPNVDEGTDEWPTIQPTSWPTERPTEWPTELPTERPTEYPTEYPTEWPTAQPTVDKCDYEHRHRKPWNQISTEERNLYITGIKKLNELGIQQQFAIQHANDISKVQAHGTAAFGPWHRYFLWEIESQIRDLGGEYKCFTMPYWDWSYETTQSDDISKWIILNSGLGGAGDINDDFCIPSGDSILGKGNGYNPYLYCSYNTTQSQCCLQRDPCNSLQTTCNTISPSDMMNLITQFPIHGDLDGFTAQIERKHGQYGHGTIGGSGIGHLAKLGFSPDDPIFFLLHGYADYMWALWQDCYDYDLVSENELTLEMYGGMLGEPNGDQLLGPSRIDDELIYNIIGQQYWSYLIKNNWKLTPRDMHNLERWDVSYEKGPFFELAKVEKLCDNINDKWFYNINDGTVNTEIPDTKWLEYSDSTYDLLEEHLSSNDDKNFRVKKWSLMNCEFNKMTMPKRCSVPKYFDDCSDLPRNGYGDIDISLDELLNKVSNHECMMDTRRRNYEWAKSTHTLKGLCRGEYDRFCDEDFLHDENPNTCQQTQQSSTY